MPKKLARIRWWWLALGACAAAMLIVNPTRPEPGAAEGMDLLATNAPPAEIAGILKAACYDCHSGQTEWPWYSRVAPVSWWVVGHVNEGREALDLSDWPHDDTRRAAKKWRSIANEVESGTMPLPSYTWGHPKARLTPGQRNAFVEWARAEADRLSPVSDD